MAKIIKVGSQNPTFTSGKAKKASHIHTQRNSNEVTNPFKFTNFEGNTLQFADVFEGFKPSFKSTHANKLRMIASSVTGTMSKIKSSIPESIANFVGRIRERASMMKHDFLERPMIKKANEVLFTPIYVKDIIYGIILDAKCSEHSARMNSMRNATDNANEVIDKLQLLYNRARQNVITNELIDIIGGANAIGGED